MELYGCIVLSFTIVCALAASFEHSDTVLNNRLLGHEMIRSYEAEYGVPQYQHGYQEYQRYVGYEDDNMPGPYVGQYHYEPGPVEYHFNNGYNYLGHPNKAYDNIYNFINYIESSKGLDGVGRGYQHTAYNSHYDSAAAKEPQQVQPIQPVNPVKPVTPVEAVVTESSNLNRVGRFHGIGRNYNLAVLGLQG